MLLSVPGLVMACRDAVGREIELALVPRVRQTSGMIAVSATDGRQALPQFRAASHVETGQIRHERCYLRPLLENLRRKSKLNLRIDTSILLIAIKSD